MVDQVLATGEWPDALNLPTGTGKTSMIDIAVFLMAAMPDTMPRRIVYTVDRRAIVEQTADHARRIAEAVNNPTTAMQQYVHDALLARTSSGIPLVVSELRGGIDLDNTWAYHPDQNAIVISTVMQVGTRLLFRGVGVSRGMRPIYAGLLGNDCLYLLDEVHLTPHFSNLLFDLIQFQHVKGSVPNRFAVVNMSATGAAGDNLFMLDEADHEHPIVAQRVNAAKQVCYVGDTAITSLLDSSPGAVNGVVVNAVNTAISLRKEIEKAYKQEGMEVVLLIGQMREYEKMHAAQRVLELAGANRDRSDLSNHPPVTIVATQTIEAGVDLDFTTLVSEVASPDALTQRIGRLNRRGLYAESKCYLVNEQEKTLKTSVYLFCYEDVLEVAKTLPSEGVSAQTFFSMLSGISSEQQTRSLVLSNSVMRTLVQSNPTPVVDVDPKALLYPQELPPVYPSKDVTLAWRKEASLPLDYAIQVLELYPVAGLETISVPIAKVVSALKGKHFDRDSVLVNRYGELLNCNINAIKPDDLIILAPEDGLLKDGVIATGKPSEKAIAQLDIADDVNTYRATVYGHPTITRLTESEALSLGKKCESIFDNEGAFVYALQKSRKTNVTEQREGSTQRADTVVTLESHSCDVRDNTIAYARRLGLDEHLVTQLGRAAYWHDIGKADMRFQIKLYGSTMKAYIQEHGVLAKSLPGVAFGLNLGNYPKGMRHEMESLALLQSNTESPTDLEQYLVATHHGHNRAMPVHVEDNQAIEVTYNDMEAMSDYSNSILAYDHVDRFWAMYDEYGPHGIAYLEAILRLADHRASDI